MQGFEIVELVFVVRVEDRDASVADCVEEGHLLPGHDRPELNFSLLHFDGTQNGLVLLFVGPDEAVVHLAASDPLPLLPVQEAVVELPLRLDHNVLDDGLGPVLELVECRVRALVEEVLGPSVSLLLFFLKVSMGQNHIRILLFLLGKVLLLPFGGKSLLLYLVMLPEIEQLVRRQVVVVSGLRWLHN